MSVVAGIDWSMSCPAICIYDTKLKFKFDNCKFFFYSGNKNHEGSFGNIYGFKALPWETQEERFDNLSEWAMTILKKFKVSEVCMEGYAMGASKGLVFNIAENGGLLKHKMWKEGIKFHCPAPTSVKKTFSGKGNSKKQDMYESLKEKEGLDFDLENKLQSKASGSPISDIVDAFAMVHFHLNNINSKI